MPETPTGDALGGYRMTEEEVEAVIDGPQPEAPQQPPQQAPPETPAPTEPPGTQAPPTEVAPAEPPPSGETPTEVAGEQPPPGEQPEAFEWAGRSFPSREVAEQSYTQIQALQTRTALERNQAIQVLRQWLPIIQERQREQQPQPQSSTTSPAGEELDPETAAAIQPLIDQRVAEATARVRQEQMAQMESQQALAEAQSAIDGFFTGHPEVTQNGPEDNAVKMFLDEFELFPERDTLDIALEAIRTPALMEAFRAAPDLVLTDAGVAMARRLASLPTLQRATDTRRPAGSETPEERAAREAAHVETGPSGPPVAPTPADLAPEVKEILELAAQDKKQSAFGI